MTRLALVAGVLAVGALWLGGVACAATYYVDSAAGSNNNDGLSQQTAWQSPPGLGGSGSGWKQIRAGDRIILKRGSTFTGLWRLNSSWYQATGATRANPMRIEVADSWGSGPVTLSGGIWLTSQGVTLDGKTGEGHSTRDASHNPIATGYGFIVNVDASKTGGQIDQGMVAEGKEQRFSHVLFRKAGSVSYGVIRMRNITDSDFNYVFVDGMNSSNNADGWILGDGGSICQRVTLNYCYAGNLGGPGSYMEGGDNRWIGFWSGDQAGPNVLNHCISFNNGGRCYDFGGESRPTGTVVFNYCEALNGHASGFGVNGEDASSPVPFIIYNYCVAYNCADYGWKIYEVNGDVWLNNCVATRNRNGVYGYGGGGAKGNIRPTVIHLRNCAVFANRSSDVQTGTLYQTTLPSPWDNFAYDISNCAFWGSPYLGGCHNTNFTYAQAAEWGSWIVSRSDVPVPNANTGCLTPATPGFNPGMAAPEDFNFRLAAGSSLIDRGTACTRGPVAISLDYYGNAIPSGVLDIGVCEYRAGSTSPPPAPTGLVAVPE